MTEKRKVVISYDIRDNKRRKKISDLLLNYGFRMNFSVFECFISHFQLTEIHKNLNTLINKKEDSILIYPLDKISASQSIYIGTMNFPSSSIIFV